jgi:hypothetical protein
MSCEDFPCCGHEAGCCPDFGEDGQQLNMRCTCGARLPVDSRFSICDSCLDFDDDFGMISEGYDDFDDSLDDHDDLDDGFEIDDDTFCYDHGFYGDEC